MAGSEVSSTRLHPLGAALAWRTLQQDAAYTGALKHGAPRLPLQTKLIEGWMESAHGGQCLRAARMDAPTRPLAPLDRLRFLSLINCACNFLFTLCKNKQKKQNMLLVFADAAPASRVGGLVRAPYPSDTGSLSKDA